VIDHKNPGNNKIFVTCDASDWLTGVMLSFGETWETAQPVTFDSMQLKAAVSGDVSLRSQSRKDMGGN
jgi:hypothetical protein